jgi:alpha-galactosidase
MRGLMLVPFVALAVVSALPSNFPPGWNKEATSPPMAWRSWNAYLANINAGIIKGNIDALVSKNEASVENGGLASLWDVGFKSIGIDEGWECCGCGVDHTQHDAQGNPVIDTNKFPDMGSLVKYGHDHNVKMGWYLNGCACGERTEKMINYQGDVRNLAKLGFDSVKLDGCGHQKNMTLYATLMNNTGKTFETENCHWGICSDDDGSSCPTKDWCPFNL